MHPSVRFSLLEDHYRQSKVLASAPAAAAAAAAMVAVATTLDVSAT